MPKTPLLAADNVFETIYQYPTAALTASSEAVGREPRRVADGRRDRTWWEAATDGGGNDHWLKADLGVGASGAVNYLFIDRGHNLWGQSLSVSRGDVDGSWTETRALTVPAAGTVGGNPESTTMAVTEEGALYAFWTPAAATRYHVLFILDVAAFIPKVTGAMLGTRVQLLGYSATFDDDAGSRKMASGESDAGYLATGRIYHWRTLELDLKLIGAAEYDGAIRGLRRLLFEQGAPVLAVMDYETRPERAGLFAYDGRDWGFPTRKVHREGRIRLREHHHRITR